MLVSPASTPLSLPTSLCVVSELWFNDGNIILENEDSTFKVYSGLLARKSSVFKDMFTFPQPAGKEETPTVRLYDSTEALTAFLKAILDPEYVSPFWMLGIRELVRRFFEAPPSATELSIVGGILRLSGKYDTQFLRLRALRHIESTYPSSLDGWKSRDAHRTIPPIVYTPFAVLPLIREFELCWALPAVLYCLCSHSVPQIHDGVEWCERKITINADDRRRVLVGRAELVHLQNHLSLACLRQSPHPDCTSPSDCAEQRRKWLNLISEWDIADPLDCLNENMDGLKSDLCLACFTQSKCKFEEAQVEIWERLPQIFGLSSWTELNALKEEAMNVQ